MEIRQPPDPAAPLKQLAAGRVDLAISYEPEVLRARDKGLNVVSVGALVQRPLTSIISLPKAGVRAPADLEGKTVGTAGIDYQSAYLRTILLEAGVTPSTVKERNVGFGLVPALLTGKVDATLGAFWNYEGVDLKRRGRKPRIIRVDDAGVPDLQRAGAGGERGRARARRRHDPRLRRRALAGRARPARRTRTRRIDGLLEANPDLDPGLQRAALEATLPLFSPPRGKPFAWQDPAAVGRVRGLDEGEPAARGARRRPRGVHERAAARAPGL